MCVLVRVEEELIGCLGYCDDYTGGGSGMMAGAVCLLL